MLGIAAPIWRAETLPHGMPLFATLEALATTIRLPPLAHPQANKAQRSALSGHVLRHTGVNLGMGKLM